MGAPKGLEGSGLAGFGFGGGRSKAPPADYETEEI
jgi:hypothetical protein